MEDLEGTSHLRVLELTRLLADKEALHLAASVHAGSLLPNCLTMLASCFEIGPAHASRDSCSLLRLSRADQMVHDAEENCLALRRANEQLTADLARAQGDARSKGTPVPG